MRRSLRPRKSQPNYAVISAPTTSGSEEENQIAIAVLEDESSGSDFGLEVNKDDAPVEDEDEDMGTASDEDLNEMDIDSEEEPAIVAKPKSTKPKKASTLAPRQVAGGMRQRLYVLPTPSVHHRHRAVPLYAPRNPVERLLSRPKPFSPTKTVLTNSFTHDAKTTDRLNKVWGYNVGPGPSWESVEDRAWFKEAKDNAEIEADRRPIVYSDLKSTSECSVLEIRCVSYHYLCF